MIYNSKTDNTIGEDLKNMNELHEGFLFLELSKLSDEGLQSFIESDEAKVLTEAGMLNKKTLVKLSKFDDLSRRTTMAAFQHAKEAGDSLWDQLVKVRIKERELIGKIEKKYMSKATKSARMGQKTYLKSNKISNFNFK